jgi:hypothetical protein
MGRGCQGLQCLPGLVGGWYLQWLPENRRHPVQFNIKAFTGLRSTLVRLHDRNCLIQQLEPQTYLSAPNRDGGCPTQRLAAPAQ